MELFKAISRFFRKRTRSLRTGDCVQFIGRELKQKNPEYYPELYQQCVVTELLGDIRETVAVCITWNGDMMPNTCWVPVKDVKFVSRSVEGERNA